MNSQRWSALQVVSSRPAQGDGGMRGMQMTAGSQGTQPPLPSSMHTAAQSSDSSEQSGRALQAFASRPEQVSTVWAVTQRGVASQVVQMRLPSESTVHVATHGGVSSEQSARCVQVLASSDSQLIGALLTQWFVGGTKAQPPEHTVLPAESVVHDWGHATSAADELSRWQSARLLHAFTSSASQAAGAFGTQRA